MFLAKLGILRWRKAGGLQVLAGKTLSASGLQNWHVFPTFFFFALGRGACFCHEMGLNASDPSMHTDPHYSDRQAGFTSAAKP